MSKKLIAGFMAAIIALVTAVSPALATTALKDVPGVLGVPGTDLYVIIGAGAASSDVVGAVDVASRLAGASSQTVNIPAAAGVASVTGGVSLDTADTKLYLADYTNKSKTILTSTDLSDLLVSGTVQDASGTDYTYSQYLNMAYGKQIQFAQPDVAANIKDPAYLISLGTSVSNTSYMLQAWVSFTKAFNASNAVGKELDILGKAFTISSETDTTKLVLFGLADKATIVAGENKTITVGSVTHTATLVGINPTTPTAVLNVDGVQKSVTAGNTYTFGSTSVYVSDVFYYKVPTETGSVVISIGADRYVLQANSAVRKGTSGNEQDVKGTWVTELKGGPQALTDIRISMDAYSASPAVNYITAGTTWTDPMFGVKVTYNGPAPTVNQDILIQPGATNYYTITFTDKYGKSATVPWLYNSSSATSLADSTGNTIHVVENESAALNEYLFVSAGSFPHMLKVASLDNSSSASPKSVTLRDVFSGTEYKATNTTGQAVIDGQSYNVYFTSSGVSVADSETGTVMLPTLGTQYGALVALTKPANATISVGVNTIVLPTGSVTIGANGTHFNITQTGALGINGTAQNATVGTVWYQFNVVRNQLEVRLANQTALPAILVVEEQSKDPAVRDALTLYASFDSGTDKRLELQTPLYTHATGSIFAAVGTGSTYVTDYATEWGTKVVYDTTAAGTATITYPDTQAYHLVAVGSNPIWSVGTVSGGTYNQMVPIKTAVAKLDTDPDVATLKTTKNLISVGGPCVNQVTAAAMGLTYPSCGASSTIPSNEAIIKVIDDVFATGKKVVVVAGWEAANTRTACEVLQKYDTLLSGITSSAVTITSATVSGVVPA